MRVGRGACQGHPLPTCGAARGEGRLSPHEGKPIVHGSRQHCIHQLQPSPRGQPRTVEGTLWGKGEMSPPPATPHRPRHVRAKLQGTKC